MRVRRLVRWVFAWAARLCGLVVLDETDYREAQTQAHALWHYVVHSGHIPNRYHAHSRIRSQTRRIAARLGHPIDEDNE